MNARVTNSQNPDIRNQGKEFRSTTKFEENLPKKTVEEDNNDEYVRSSPTQRVSNMKPSAGSDSKVCDLKNQASVPKIPWKVRKLENGDINCNAMKMRIVQMRITQEGKEHLAHQQGVLCKSVLQNHDGKPTSSKESR